MLTYSRLQLISLCSWPKLSSIALGFQTSRHCSGLQQAKPLSPSVWSAIKSAGLLRKTRGKRGGRLKNFTRTNHRKTEDKDISEYHNISTVTLGRCQQSKKFAYLPQRRCLIPIKAVSQQNDAILRSKLGLWNARSITTKAASICDYVISEKLSILAITETWMKGDQRDNVTVSTIQLSS